MKKKILVFSSKPPETYINALRLVNARYDCVFAPDDFTPSAGINIIRDAAELKAVDYFVKRNLPVLGVCRGAQILNVYFGGKLSLVDNHYDYAKDLYHSVTSLSANVFYPNFPSVNSSHKQRCYPLALCAKPLLASKDGTIEAFSAGENVLAVQFHPERMTDSAIKAVYGKFVEKVD